MVDEGHPRGPARASSGTWRAALHAALRGGDRTALLAVPKTDLHCHAFLSAPLGAYALDGAAAPPAPPPRFGSFEAFTAYLLQHLAPRLTTVARVRSVLRAALERMRAEGVVYAEVSVDLTVPTLLGMRVEEFAELVAEECARPAPGLQVAPEVGIARTLPVDEVERGLRRWVGTGVFGAVDLYDDERIGSWSDFAPLFRLAADHGLKRKAHAGELCGAESVREAVLSLELDAVQHGVRAVEDPRVLELLAARGTVLHVCPTSNVSLGVVPSLADHPARRLLEAGIPITVNSDDYATFGAGVTDELLNLSRMGFSAAQVERVVATGLAQMPGSIES